MNKMVLIFGNSVIVPLEGLSMERFEQLQRRFGTPKGRKRNMANLVNNA